MSAVDFRRNPNHNRTDDQNTQDHQTQIFADTPEEWDQSAYGPESGDDK